MSVIDYQPQDKDKPWTVTFRMTERQMHNLRSAVDGRHMTIETWWRETVMPLTETWSHVRPYDPGKRNPNEGRASDEYPVGCLEDDYDRVESLARWLFENGEESNRTVPHTGEVVETFEQLRDAGGESGGGWGYLMMKARAILMFYPALHMNSTVFV